ncbi:hypothetical protein [Sphingomonas jatrophae]|uniref:Uncharacterized protein n=1 Tax=Sphingomonas jatrophae TaxID=1166337 RepID=A0A1I6JRC2_9SPHN|nr:hypothetical protein [Sphingomonas jatrophae]SFR81524.1 hypothetical protein SAMN05192580_0718 [Sphingomonas jatrophae]
MKKWLIAVAAVSASVPAQAHWQFTKWGMTPTQVITVSNGMARKGEGDASAQGDATREVVGDYAAGSFKFAVSYWFDGTGLTRVTMSQHDDAACRELQRDLTAKYDEPVEYEGGSVQRRMWADKPSGNRVVLISSNLAFCELQYAPLVSRAGAGL